MTVRDTRAMIAEMAPRLDGETYVFCALPETARAEGALATFHEAEGLSAILPLAEARARGLAADQPMRRITLEVASALGGVGLTAAVAGALSAAGVPCNVVAALHHDHVFVPAARAEDALDLLRECAAKAAR